MKPYIIRIWGPYESPAIRDEKKDTEKETNIAIVFANNKNEATNIAYFISNMKYSKLMSYDKIKLLPDYQLIDSFTRQVNLLIFNPQDVIHFTDEQMKGIDAIKKSNIALEDPTEAPDLSLFYAALYKSSMGEDIPPEREADAACFVYSKDDLVANRLCISFAIHVLNNFNPFEEEGNVKSFEIKERIIYWNPQYIIYDEIDINEKGNALIEQKLYDDAIEAFNLLLEINPNFVDGFFNRAHCYSMKGNYEWAIMDMTKAINADEQPSNAYAYRGGIYQKLGRYQEAIDDFTQAIKYDPSYLLYRGQAYKALKLYDKAIEDVNKALKINPQDIQAIKLYNKLSDEMNKKSGGEIEIEKGWIKRLKTRIFKKNN